VPASEVGPERLGYVDLGVGDLPQQVVADAHFAARANEQIRIRLTGRVEEAGKTLLVELLGPDASLDRTTCRVDDLRAAAIVERDVEQHPAVVGGPFHGGAQFVLNIVSQIVHAADDAEPDVVGQQRLQL
jgi:hypothetical protein